MKRILTICFLFSALTACQHPPVWDTAFTVKGIDVSRYQQVIDWQRVEEQEVHFAFAKATEGADFRDSFFVRNWEGMACTKILKGAYHFFLPASSALEQIENFKSFVPLEVGDLPPVLDVETAQGIDKDSIIKGVRAWLIAAEDHYKVRPILYTNQTFYYRYLIGEFDDYPLWIARYHVREPQMAVGQHWDFWQYSNRGTLDGIAGDVDFNAYSGSLQQLQTLCIPSPLLTLK